MKKIGRAREFRYGGSIVGVSESVYVCVFTCTVGWKKRGAGDGAEYNAGLDFEGVYSLAKEF